MSEQDQKSVKSYSLSERHIGIIRDYAIQEGRSESDALRRILDQWQTFQGAQRPLFSLDVQNSPEATR